MVWRIHSWSGEEGCGEVVSAHFGPWPFGPRQNPEGTTDFHPDDEVFVELDKTPDGYVVRAVRLAHRAKQPPGTELAGFDDVNGCGDLRLDERSADRLVFWAGDCCEWCSPTAPRLVFNGVTAFVGWDEDAADFDPSCPLLRRASREEIDEHQLTVPDGSTAYCIVTPHGTGSVGDRVFIVAQHVEVRRVSPMTP